MTYVYSAITTETKKLGINRFCVHLFLCRDICTITRGYLEKSREIIMTSPNMTYISVDMKSMSRCTTGEAIAKINDILYATTCIFKRIY